MFRPSPERAVALYVEEDGDEARCRICGRGFPSREEAAGHVKGLLAMQALSDHCRIHGFSEGSQPAASPRVAPMSLYDDEEDDEAASSRRSLWDLLPFRW